MKIKLSLALGTAVLSAGMACPPTGGPADAGHTDPPVDVTLDPPPDGEGWQWTTGSFEVPAGAEVQDCYFYQVPGTPGTPVYVNKLVVAQNEGSHHMNLFRVKTIVGLDPANGQKQTGLDGMGECFKSPNWADWPLVINSQSGGNIEWELPPGVAHKFDPGEWIMIQTHYVNATTQATPVSGKVFVNFHQAPASTVTAELGTLFATKQSIRICQNNPSPVFEGSCQFNSTQPLTIVGANGHFHSRGKQFQMFTWDGTSTTTPPMSDRFYVSEEWDDPPMSRSPELTVPVVAGGGVWYTCGYEWEEPPPSVGCDGLNADDATRYGTQPADLDCCYTFGGIVEKSEHCNIFVYYYPKIDDIGCF